MQFQLHPQSTQLQQQNQVQGVQTSQLGQSLADYRLPNHNTQGSQLVQQLQGSGVMPAPTAQAQQSAVQDKQTQLNDNTRQTQEQPAKPIGVQQQQLQQNIS